MNPVVETDRALIAALPLPLAQAWRRALYAESAAAQHERAFFVLEAGLKYLASAAVMSWAVARTENEAAGTACGALVKPSLGHWVRMLRACRGALSSDHPARRWLDAILNSSLENQVKGLEGKTIGAILDDSLPAYRNSVSAHGSGLTSAELEERAPAILTVARHFLSKLVGENAPLLAGRAGGCVMRLMGPTANIEGESFSWAADQSLVLRFRERVIPLAPLWVFDHEHDDVLVMNKGAGLEKVEYLSYGNPREATGVVTFRDQRAMAARQLLAKVTGQEALGTTEIESLINETEVAELANRASGAQYGPYRVVRQVHAGGQGILYEAVGQDPPRRVALKMLPLQRALSPSARRRMKEEAATLAQVEHPNIVPIYETGETDGIPWIAMKFVDGKNLDEILQQLKGRSGSVTLADFRAAASTATGGSSEEHAGKTYAERIVSVIREAARALAACHQHGIVHRDIKPSNLMVDTSGRVILTDFGLARSVESRAQTFTQELVGTLQYLAPESLVPTGRSGPDGRVDVYGLGATLYECLSLHRPFEEYEHDKAALLHAVQIKEPQTLRRVAPWIPRELDTVVMKAMERDRDRRYATVNEFADDLDRFLRGEPVRAKPAGAFTITQKWIRRNPAKSVMALTALSILGGWGLWRNAEQRRFEQAEQQAAKIEQDIYYLGGSMMSTLGLNHPGNEAYLNAEVLADASRTVSQMETQLSQALDDSALSQTSNANRLADRHQEIVQQKNSLDSLAVFYEQSDLSWFLLGQERDEEARMAGQLAIESIKALNDPQWWQSFAKTHPLLQKVQIEQLCEDVHRQLILLAALRAKPLAVDFTAPPDRYVRDTREVLDQAERYKKTAAGAIIDWFCRMRMGEKDLAPLPEPVEANDYFILGMTHFWIAQFAQSNLGKMVLAQAPPQGGLDLKNPAETSIQQFRIACGLDPQQYWHHFMLAWALSETGHQLLNSPVSKTDESNTKKQDSSWLAGLTKFAAGSKVPTVQVDPVLTYFHEAELALNSCITLRPTFPRGYELRGRVLVLQSLRTRKLDLKAKGLEPNSTPTADKSVPPSLEAQHLETRGIADFDRARKLAPYDPDVHWARAHTMDLLQRDEQAELAYRLAMQLDSPMGRMTGQDWVAKALAFLERKTKAATGDEKNEKLAGTWGTLALARLLSSQVADEKLSAKFLNASLEAAEKSLALNESDLCGLTIRGTIRLRRGDSKLALADFETALTLDDKNYLAAAGRGGALEQLKEFEKSREAWQFAAEECAVVDWQKSQCEQALSKLQQSK